MQREEIMSSGGVKWPQESYICGKKREREIHSGEIASLNGK